MGSIIVNYDLLCWHGKHEQKSRLVSLFLKQRKQLAVHPFSWPRWVAQQRFRVLRGLYLSCITEATSSRIISIGDVSSYDTPFHVVSSNSTSFISYSSILALQIDNKVRILTSSDRQWDKCDLNMSSDWTAINRKCNSVVLYSRCLDMSETGTI